MSYSALKGEAPHVRRLGNGDNSFASCTSAYSGYTQDANESTAVFKHRPPPDGPWIRLVVLRPGTRLEPIRCLIFHKLLNDAIREYDALSYVCGSGRPLRWIYVNDMRFAIRQKLFNALVTLRSEENPTTLWADAICIEQDNLTEKSHQVQQMSTVYRNGRLTRIWLGKGPGDMWKTFQDALSDCDLLRRSRFDEGDKLQTIKKRASKNLEIMIKAQYWRRLWIVQEVLLSQNLQIHIGSLTTSYADFVRFCEDNGDCSLATRCILYTNKGCCGAKTGLYQS